MHTISYKLQKLLFKQTNLFFFNLEQKYMHQCIHIKESLIFNNQNLEYFPYNPKTEYLIHHCRDTYKS